MPQKVSTCPSVLDPAAWLSACTIFRLYVAAAQSAPAALLEAAIGFGPFHLFEIRQLEVAS